MKPPITAAQAMSHPAVFETVNSLGQMTDTSREALIKMLIECLAGPAALTTREATAIKDAADMLEADAREIEGMECDYTDQVMRAIAAEEKLAQQAAVHPWLIKKEPHSKDKYYVAEGSPPDRVLEIYGIKPQGDKP